MGKCVDGGYSSMGKCGVCLARGGSCMFGEE